jgi:hypothetical protein
LIRKRLDTGFPGKGYVLKIDGWFAVLHLADRIAVSLKPGMGILEQAAAAEREYRNFACLFG